jgi:hypothetical protein
VSYEQSVPPGVRLMHSSGMTNDNFLKSVELQFGQTIFELTPVPAGRYQKAIFKAKILENARNNNQSTAK